MENLKINIKQISLKTSNKKIVLYAAIGEDEYLPEFLQVNHK